MSLPRLAIVLFCLIGSCLYFNRANDVRLLHLVAEALQDLKADSVVHLQGALVAVEDADGRRWRSSLSRTDTGAGACELMWLERLSLLD